MGENAELTSLASLTKKPKEPLPYNKYKHAISTSSFYCPDWIKSRECKAKPFCTRLHPEKCSAPLGTPCRDQKCKLFHAYPPKRSKPPADPSVIPCPIWTGPPESCNPKCNFLHVPISSEIALRAPLWTQIISNLDPKTFTKAPLVCKLWKAIFDSPKFLKRKQEGAKSFLSTRFSSNLQKSPWDKNHVAEAVRCLKAFSRLSDRGFVETVDLQVHLINYDPSRDRRFCGSLELPFPLRKNWSICVIGNPLHCEEARKLGIVSQTTEDLAAFKKDKKKIKNFFKEFDMVFASGSIIRSIPRILGPRLNKMGKFPFPLEDDCLVSHKIEKQKKIAKFQLKKSHELGVPVGHVDLTEDQLLQNILESVSFLTEEVLSKLWGNVGSLHIKSTMGPSLKIWPCHPRPVPQIQELPKTLHPPTLISTILPELFPNIERYYLPRAVTPEDPGILPFQP